VEIARGGDDQMSELSKDSSLSDIGVYIRSFKRPPFAKKDALSLLENLSNLGIDSYSFSYGANTASRTINKEIITHLEKYLESYQRRYKNHTQQYAFGRLKK
jgi:hypothetical protein